MLVGWTEGVTRLRAVSASVPPAAACVVTGTCWGGASRIDSPGALQSCGAPASVGGRVLSVRALGGLDWTSLPGPQPGVPRHPTAPGTGVSASRMKDLGAEHLAGHEGVQLLGLLNLYLEQEERFQPREKGLSLIEATPENDNTLCPGLRNAKVEDLRSLANFFGSCTETFVLAVNILDRFLALMKVKPKHLSCIGVCSFLLAARIVEEDCNIPSIHDVIRISQCKCTASDIKRMEKIISEKLHYELEATTALNFLHLYHTIILCHTSERKEILSLDKLEAQLKACNCRLVFSKAKPSVLALCLLNLEVETLKSVELLEILLLVKKHSKINDTEFFYWRELVSKCLAEYSSPECCKPDLKKLVWIVSRRTAQNLHNSYYSVPELPTIPEGGCFDESESEDSCEDMSCGEESLSSSPPSDQECTFFFNFKVAQTLCFPS
ncbi:cyclin-G2 isoform X1 [Hylobates moloch]|uniref:cyclin-G2 isoform X1 n=2 Tax=Hylobates moloch TaxID=81572 RepID=UPI0013634010|nr:cyclin-G2 isoform X1 [Hylobates moloch]